MTILPDIPQAWPEAIVDIGPIEISAGYWGVVGLIPYDGHVVLAVIPNQPGRRGSVERREGATTHLDTQAQLDITRRAEESGTTTWPT